MTKTMADLRREVARRLRDTLHGKEIDTIEKGTPQMEHMLGVVPLGAISTPKAEKGTILDHHHAFWDEYHETIDTPNKAKREIRTAIYSLKEDDIFRVNSPYGDDAGILYVEVGDLDESPNRMITTCAECGASIETEPEIVMNYGKYSIKFDLDCEQCDFEQRLSKLLEPVGP